MNIPNYVNYGMCIYESQVTGLDKYKLGDVVIDDQNDIGVVIQVHSQDEFRTDMFGNASAREVRMATDEEISLYRPDILKQGTFKHNKKSKP